MRREVIMLLVAMTVLTAVYIGAVVGADTNSNIHGEVYTANRCRSESPPAIWYNQTDLGIIHVVEYDNGSWLHIAVNLERVRKELSPLQVTQPVFKHNDKFYQVSPLWSSPGLPDRLKGWQVPAGGLVGIGWLVTGAVAVINGRKKK